MAKFGSFNLSGTPKPVKYDYQTVIAIDPRLSCIRFYAMSGGNTSTLQYEEQKCRFKQLDGEFFQTFQNIVTAYADQHPAAQNAGVTVIVPDNTVVTETVSIPTLRRRQIDESLGVVVADLYKNANALKVNKFMTNQNKQYTSFGLSMIQQSILDHINAACTAAKMPPQAVTFATNALVNAVQTGNPKLHSATYLLMDIAEDGTQIAFVSRGRTAGFFQLPFGHTILERNRLAAEDMLFDHSPAELLVLNAKEKARAKQLTMMQNEGAAQVAQSMAQDMEDEAAAENAVPAEENYDEEETEPDVFSSAAANQTAQSATIKTLPKKQPRKLPKFMLREQPHTEEEYGYENMRLFVKWALNLIEANRRQLFQDKPEAVYVNLPSEYQYLFDMINKEKKDNGITFAPLECQNITGDILNNLDLYGGFFTAQMNESNNF